jgi:anti-sigma factor RsiW
MESDRERLSRHIGECAGCAAYLQELAKLMPLVAKSDDPPQSFWIDYSRELRQKIDDAVEQKTWWRNLGAFLAPRYLAAYASTAVIILALTFSFEKNPKSGASQLDDDEIAELLPVAENLDFFSAMDILDDFDLIDWLGTQGKSAA